MKDSSQDIVNEMLQTLNIQKEMLVKLRKEIPECIKCLKVDRFFKDVHLSHFASDYLLCFDKHMKAKGV